MAMAEQFVVYYDSGTSNSRIYLLDDQFQVRYTESVNVGSKDTSITGSNLKLLQGLKRLYDGMLSATGISESQVTGIYASGMITSPYGLLEVPHKVIPISVEEMADSIVSFYEDQLFHREICLVPGLKTTGSDVTMVNNMRGEEIEIIGTLDALREKYPGRKVALILPGSHTHIALVEGDKVTGILSSMTGELFYALKTSTILSAVLSEKTEGLDPDMVRLGVHNLDTYGLNRAIYICHAMRLFGKGTPLQRKSYAEGVINGGFAKGLAWYCEHEWQGCDTAVIVSNAYMHDLYNTLLENHPYIHEIDWLPISKEKSYGVEGLKKLLSCKKER